MILATSFNHITSYKISIISFQISMIYMIYIYDIYIYRYIKLSIISIKVATIYSLTLDDLAYGDIRQLFLKIQRIEWGYDGNRTHSMMAEGVAPDIAILAVDFGVPYVS